VIDEVQSSYIGARAAQVGLSCRGPHEQRVAEVEELISRNASVQRVAGRAKFAAPAFYLFMCAIFTGYGLLSSREMKFIVLLGIGFLIFGAYVLVANLRAFGKAALSGRGHG